MPPFTANSDGRGMKSWTAVTLGWHRATRGYTLIGMTVLVAIAFSGCQSLMIQKTDSKGVIATKVLGRAAQAAFTMGVSEVYYAKIRHLNKTMASWMGGDVNGLLRAWGQPNMVLPDGRGGKIYCYRMERSYTTPGQSYSHTTGSAYTSGQAHTFSANTTTTYTPPRTYRWTASRDFWVNSAGVIYKWQT